MNSFNLQISNERDVQVVSVSGYVGRDQCYRLERELSGLLRQGSQAVVLDCKHLTCITNASLKNLNLWAEDFQQHGGQFRVVGLSRATECNAELAGFKKTVFLSDVAAAKKALNNSTPLPRKESTNKK